MYPNNTKTQSVTQFCFCNMMTLDGMTGEDLNSHDIIRIFFLKEWVFIVTDLSNSADKKTIFSANVITGINENNKHKNIKNSMSAISKEIQIPVITKFTNFNNLTDQSLQI